VATAVLILATGGLCVGCGRLSGPPTTATGTTPLPGGVSLPNPRRYGGRSNLATNPGFETTTAPWQPYGSASIVRVTSAARYEGRHAALVVAGSTAPYGVQLAGFVGFPAAGSTYVVSAWLRSPERPKRVAVILVGYTAKGAAQTLVQQHRLIKGRWTHVAVHGRVRGSSLQSLTLAYVVERSIALGDRFLIDAVVIRSH
jgi:Carbohydrate binding domain